MSNSPQCYGGYNAVRLRACKLDSAGVPTSGSRNLYVSDKLISIQASYQIEKGSEFTLKNGDGSICATAKDCDKLKRVTLNMVLCSLDPELLYLCIGGTLWTGNTVATGKPIGIDFPNSDSACSNGISLEAWVRAWDGSAQANTAAPLPLYWHFGWPKTTWVPGQKTLQNGLITQPVTGDGTTNHAFTNGPGNDLPFTPDGPEFYYLDTNLPTATCGATSFTSS